MKVFIFGANGFIGKNLLSAIAKKYNVSCLIRNNFKKPIDNITVIIGDVCKDSSWHKEMQSCDVVINLCGNDVAQNWNAKVKKQIKECRIATTKNIVTHLKPSQVLINASAIGYYGAKLHEKFTENSPLGKDFLAQVASQWESEAQKAQDKGCRVIIMRLAVVLGHGGVLESMVNSFQKYLGGKIGSGRQYFSWIHIEDVIHFILESIAHENYQGIYNLSSPTPVSYNELNEILNTLLPRRIPLKIPNFLLKATIGEFANTILEGQYVIPERLQKQNYIFKYPNIKNALENILRKE